MTEPQTLPDLIQPQERQRRRRRRPKHFRTVRRIGRQLRKANWRIISVMAVGILAVVIMSGLVLVSNARDTLNKSWLQLNRVWQTVNSTPGTDLTLREFERLQTSVDDFADSLGSARRQTAFLRPFGSLHPDLDTALKSLDAARKLSQAATNILDGMEPAMFYLTGGEEDDTIVPQLSSGERVVELLNLGRGRFLKAEEQLQEVDSILNDLQLAEVSPDLFVTIDGLTQYYEQMYEINRILLDSPDLLSTALGLNRTQTYLILSQNSDELRPSGGYISTYGWIRVRGGRIVDYDYRATTATSPNPPDRSLASQVQIPTWWIQYDEPIFAAWDSSWYADFPSTAELAAWYYDNGGNPQSPVDGVIAIDIVAFEYILEGLHSVTVPDFGETITATNFREAVYRIRAEGEGSALHKQFLAALYRQILADWQSVDRDQSIELRGAVLRALQEKHIMIYSKDDRLNRAFEALHWAGMQEPAVTQDYLMVADANLGNKSNRSIIRQLTADVEIQPDGTLKDRVAVTYEYPDRVAKQDPAVRPEHYNDINYNNLMQVFVPANSTLLGTGNLRFEPETVYTETHTAFAALTRVDYNQNERFQFSYTTPVLIEQFGPYRRYRLQLQKQPGMRGEQVNVTIALPPDTKVVSTSPAVATSYELENPILEFRIELVTDKSIEVIYRLK